MEGAGNKAVKDMMKREELDGKEEDKLENSNRKLNKRESDEKKRN